MSVYAESLEDHLSQYDPTPQAETDRERFVIDAPEKADWALRKLRKINAERSEVVETATREIGRIQEWADLQEGRLDKDASYFESLLAEYHADILQADPKAKTVSLPNGTLKARKLPDKWEIADSDFLKWAREHRPDWIRIKEETDKKALKASAQVAGSLAVDPGTGETIPGVTVLPGVIKFSAEAEK